MKIIAGISDLLIPLLILYIVGYGVLQKVNCYEIFVGGAKEGLGTAVKILPTLVGLMVAVGILRASGLLDALAGIFGAVTEPFGFPAELVPLGFVRLFSASAAVGMLTDLYSQFGTDSSIGFTASLMMCCTETVFYTMSVYYMAAGVRKSRWTLPGALLVSAAGIAASVALARMFV